MSIFNLFSPATGTQGQNLVDRLSSLAFYTLENTMVSSVVAPYSQSGFPFYMAEFNGTGLTYSTGAPIQPTGGSITSLQVFNDLSGTILDVQGMQDQAATIGSLIQSDNGRGLAAYLLRGNDRITGTAEEDVLAGGAGNDVIRGEQGNDRIYGETGNDRLFGGSQDDLLYGGAGVEQLTGGAGTDWFVFGGPADSGVGAGRRDVIMDFTDGDLIYLRGIDARAGTAGDQNFTFIGTAAFSAEGQVRAAQAGTDVILSLNMRGATGAEMEIRLEDVLVSSLTTADFRL
jgi:Ca2+-binding RTX toxin-like protein